MLGSPHVRGWLCGFVVATMLLVGSIGQAQDVEVVAESHGRPDGQDQVSVTRAMQAHSFFSFNRSVYGPYGLTDNVTLAVRSTHWTMISGVGVHDNVP